MANKEAEVFYNLTKDGRCPNPKCNMQIKIITSTYELHKIRYIKIFYIDGNKLGKCPKCKITIRVDIQCLNGNTPKPSKTRQREGKELINSIEYLQKIR